MGEANTTVEVLGFTISREGDVWVTDQWTEEPSFVSFYDALVASMEDGGHPYGEMFESGGSDLLGAAQVALDAREHGAACEFIEASTAAGVDLVGHVEFAETGDAFLDARIAMWNALA